MHRNGKKLAGLFLSLAALIALSRCSLKRHNDGDTVKVSIQIAGVAPGTPKAAPELVEQLYHPGGESIFGVLSTPSPEPTPPSTIAGFDCLMVNAVGRGIPPQGGYRLEDGKSIDSLIGDLLSGRYCTYPGILSQSFSTTTSSEVTLSIPAGNQRIFQVVGVIDPTRAFCGTGAPVTGNNVPIFPYEVGRAVTDVFQDISVSISNSYPSSTSTNVERRARKVACGESELNPHAIPDGVFWYTSRDAFILSGVNPTPIAQPTPGPVAAQFGLANLFGINGPTLTIPTPTPTPTPIAYASTTLNNKPILSFGSGMGLEAASTSMPSFGSYPSFTVFLVVSFADNANNNYLFGFRDNGGYPNPPDYGISASFILKADSSFFNACIKGSSTSQCAQISRSSIGSQFRIHTIQYSAQSSNSSNSSNLSYSISGGGGSDTKTFSSGLPSNFTPQHIALGYFKTGSTQTNYFRGQFTEALIFKRMLDSDEIVQVQTYLANKYGIPR